MNASLIDSGLPDSEAGRPDELIRTLLEVLETLSELDCVYVSRYDEKTCALEVTFSQHPGQRGLSIPEGLIVPWDDTLCRRALDANIHFTQYADDLWSDSDAVQRLGVRSFLSEPIRGDDGTLTGTLCGISDQRVRVNNSTLYVFRVFAQLISHQLTRQKQFDRLWEENAMLKASSLTDVLTGITNRQGLLSELERSLAQAVRTRGRVAVVFIDFDRFKAINDTHGHRVGDRFLMFMAGRLVAGSRAGELVARYGGDEFAVVATFEPGVGGEARLSQRFLDMTQACFRFGEVTIDYPGASVGVAVSTIQDDAESLLSRADQAMYEAKKTRRVDGD